ncbi:hypothetical protein Pyrfu_0024 [Pyrolobus fumarii 1A]|uniref:ArsR family transcriptional regulator n=1 Tax=Pyrolobus fumarii (strain DSM 11204 / 1A) TaxID=694429 RepID=G0EDY0_PYRF1|nr:hypothetical protein Pyrfu_0024 [Pyrolobus fumarii 1A]
MDEAKRGRVEPLSGGKDVVVYNKNIVLEKLYEDDELVVVVAPNEDQLRDILIRLLNEGPKTVKELHSMLSGLASEDKIRRALAELVEEGIVVSDNDGRYYIASPY